jgi:hypothetical protein
VGEQPEVFLNALQGWRAVRFFLELYRMLLNGWHKTISETAYRLQVEQDPCR